MAAPVIRDGIVGSALSRAGLITVPEDREALDGFVRGELRSAIAERLGADVADGVMTELWPLVARLAMRRPRSVTAQPRAAAPTTPPPAPITARPVFDGDDDPSGVVVVGARGKTLRAGDSMSVLIVVSTHTARTRELALVLGENAVVRSVVDLVDMGEAIEDHRGELPVVLFDCQHAPFHLESVATFASDLPPGSWLALLDATSEDEKTARAFAGSTLTIARIASAVGTDEVARRCRSLFD